MNRDMWNRWKTRESVTHQLSDN